MKPPDRRLSLGTGLAAGCLLLNVACQAAPAAAPTSPPAPTAAVAKPAAAPSPAASPAVAVAASPSAAAAASPKPAVSPAASPSTAVLASPSAVASARTVNFDAMDYGYTLPDSLSAGPTTLVMHNAGKEPHHAQLLKLNTGVTLDQFVAALQQGEGPALSLVSFAGGNGAIDPGSANEEVTVDLQAGSYVVLCFISGPDGVPHFAKGMIKPLTVTPASSAAPAAQPNAQLTVTLRDFAFDTPSDTLPSGRSTWRITNTGPQPHEIQVGKLTGGATAADILKFFTTPPSGPPPFTSAGGFQGVDANSGGYLTVDLTPGQYAFFCAIPDPRNGQRHLQEGMLKQVTVQ